MPQFEDRYRLIANFGKFRVVKVSNGKMGTEFTIQLPNSITLTADIGIRVDVKVGDLLTLYTEVLADALPGPTSKQ